MSANGSKDLGWWMERRAGELGLQWKDVAQASGLTDQALRNVRSGKSRKPNTATQAGIERALRWEPGSVRAILAGSRPVSLAEQPEEVSRSVEGADAISGQEVREFLQSIARVRRTLGDDAARALIRGALAQPVDGVTHQGLSQNRTEEAG